MAQQSQQGPIKFGDTISLFSSDGANSAFLSTLGCVPTAPRRGIAHFLCQMHKSSPMPPPTDVPQQH